MIPREIHLSLSIALLAFDWGAHNKALDLLMIGHRGGTRSLLGGQYGHVRGSNAWHRTISVDVLFFRFEWESATFDDGTVIHENNL
jgi:hypothetical protein